MLHSSATEWRHRFSLEVTLTGGALMLQGLLSSSGTYAPEQLVVRRREAPGRWTDEVTSWATDSSWADEMHAFARGVRGEAPIDHGLPRDAFAAMELVDRIYHAGSRRS